MDQVNMLEVYGEPLVEYQGNGQLLYAQGRSFPVAFQCVQLPNARIYLLITPSDVDEKKLFLELLPFLKGPDCIQGIEGILNDGRTFKSIGRVRLLRQSVSFTDDELFKGILALSEVEVTQPVAADTGRKVLLRFPLTNLMFVGTEPSPNGGYFILPLEIAGLRTTIGLYEDYQDRCIQMMATRDCTVTSYLDVPYEGDALDERLELTTRLCTLLSFAGGTLVNWPCYYEIGQNGQECRIYHRDSITSDYRSLAVIDHRQPPDLKNFVESVFAQFVDLSPRYQLAKVIRLVNDSKVDAGSAELRALNICSGVDFLRGRWAGLHGQTTIFEPRVFKAGIKKIKEAFAVLAQEHLGATEEQTKVLLQKFGDFNRPAFARVLAMMVADLQADISEDDIELFVRNRNQLVHEARFATDDAGQELMGIFSFVDRILLALLGYKGPYLDCRTWKRIERR